MFTIVITAVITSVLTAIITSLVLWVIFRKHFQAIERANDWGKSIDEQGWGKTLWDKL